MATKGCSKSFSRNSDNRVHYSEFEEEDPLRSHEEHCRYAAKARNRAERERIEKKYGARYRSLHDLPYFDVRMHAIDPMHNLLEGPAKRVMQTFETPGRSNARRDRSLAETDKEPLATVTRKRVAIFDVWCARENFGRPNPPANVVIKHYDNLPYCNKEKRVEAKLPVLVFRMPGGHQVVVTTAENGLPSFTVTLHTENNWKFCGPAELLNVLQPIQNQPKAAMASWQLEHPTPTEGDSGDWTVAMKKVIKNILHYVGEDPERMRPASCPTSNDATDPTPTGYKDGETESLDDSTPGFSLLTDVRLSLSPSPTVTEPTNPPSTWTPTPSSPGALLPVPKKRRLAASPRKPAPELKL
ncbi:hypothetical protein Bbelb_381610 [Branchiostoma belcheri]|nr:hypothetical protein Bbelb_381610 [Branchiostoma belcheri]